MNYSSVIADLEYIWSTRQPHKGRYPSSDSIGLVGRLVKQRLPAAEIPAAGRFLLREFPKISIEVLTAVICSACRIAHAEGVASLLRSYQARPPADPVPGARDAAAAWLQHGGPYYEAFRAAGVDYAIAMFSARVFCDLLQRVSRHEPLPTTSALGKQNGLRSLECRMTFDSLRERGLVHSLPPEEGRRVRSPVELLGPDGLFVREVPSVRLRCGVDLAQPLADVVVARAAAGAPWGSSLLDLFAEIEHRACVP